MTLFSQTHVVVVFELLLIHKGFLRLDTEDKCLYYPDCIDFLRAFHLPREVFQCLDNTSSNTLFIH